MDASIQNEITSFFKELFGDDFKLNNFSRKEGEELKFDTASDKDIKDFFIFCLNKPTIFYDPYKGTLFAYKPLDDSFFKKAVTNAWGFKYIFYPLFIENWGGWWSDYHFRIYEKGFEGNYKRINFIK